MELTTKSLLNGSGCKVHVFLIAILALAAGTLKTMLDTPTSKAVYLSFEINVDFSSPYVQVSFDCLDVIVQQVPLTWKSENELLIEQYSSA